MKRFIRKWLQSRADKAAQWKPVSPEQFRKNVIEGRRTTIALRKKHLPELLKSDPALHPGDLSYQLGRLSGDLLQLGMIDWRDGIDPRPYFAEIREHWTQALAVRPDIPSAEYRDDFMFVISDMLDWGLPFDASPPGEDLLKFDMLWMERWINAGLVDPSCWALKAKAPPTKIKFINKCLDDYWALLTDQIDPEEGIRRCVANYDRRATHPTFKALEIICCGGDYNALFIDYTLAAILKKRGLVSGTFHDWVWG
ncbi:MAG: hypothetical protein ACKOPG_05030 [Novosphingobium sp.]